MQSSKIRIYIGIVLLSLLFIALSSLIERIYQLIMVGFNKNAMLVKSKRKIIICLSLLCITGFGTLLSIPKNIVIEKIKNEEKIVISKNIYYFKEGKNKVQFKVDSLKEDTRFKIYINSIYEGYKEENLGVYNYYDNTSGNFRDEINVPKNTKKLVIKIEVQKGKLEFKDLRLNNKKLNLSYLLLPNETLSKLQDTMYGVYGDQLRLEYAKDTFKLLKNSPLIGVGGEGFKHTYGSVQESSYVSSEAHSAILQALVEVGIIGTILLIGIVGLSVCIVIKLVIRLKRISEEDKRFVILIIFIYLALLSVVVFDLAFSYAFMIYIFAIVTALLLKEYLEVIAKYDERKKQKSIFDWSYVKIIVLSLSAVTLSCATYFSFNAYRASLIKLQNRGEELTATEVAENIAYLELKNSQDEFDIDYIRELNEEYNAYKVMLTEAIVNAGNDKKLKEELKEEQEKLVVSIKNNADKMLEYEYYDKFVLNDVADIYIYNYMNFSEIYKEQFSSQEVAYAFYLNYVLKLADRIVELNPYSKKAHEIYNDMCNEYLKELEKDNKYLQSGAIYNVIEEFRKRINN